MPCKILKYEIFDLVYDWIIMWFLAQPPGELVLDEDNNYKTNFGSKWPSTTVDVKTFVAKVEQLHTVDELEAAIESNMNQKMMYDKIKLLDPKRIDELFGMYVKRPQNYSFGANPETDIWRNQPKWYCFQKGAWNGLLESAPTRKMDRTFVTCPRRFGIILPRIVGWVRVILLSIEI